MNDRTTLNQLNDVIELALCQQDAAAAVAAISLKAAHLDDLRRDPMKGESASAVLDHLTDHITRPFITPDFATSAGLPGCMTTNEVRSATDFTLQPGPELISPIIRESDGKLHIAGVGIGVAASPGSTTHVMQVQGSDDGQELTICSNRKTADGVPVWTVTKSGIRFHVEVANATFRPDSVAAA